ncbi:MAG: hypothetical protein ACI87E_003132 [Mariniblastus sp.]|jgi:hypothetical protein
MGDLKNPRWIYFKGGLFLLAGCVSVLLLWLDHPSLKAIVLTSIAVWCFCRFYYFAFYVIEHYVDSDFRFAGLVDFAKYIFKQRKSEIQPKDDQPKDERSD